MGPSISTIAPAKRHRDDEIFRSKRLKQTDLETCDDVSTGGAVKDLRSRRIYSPVHSTGLGFDSGLRDGKGDDKVPTDSISPIKSVTKSSLPKKVFKIAGSHNYRKLLPFLMDMNKDDTYTFSSSPCTLKAEKRDLGLQEKGDCSEDLKAVETEEMKNHDSELSHEAQNMDEINLSKIVGETRLHEDLKKYDISSNGVDASPEGQSVSKTDNTNLGISSSSTNSRSTTPKYSCVVNGTKGEDENSLGFNPFETGNIKKCSTLLSCEVPHMNQLINLSGPDEGVQLDNQDEKRNTNDGSSNEFEENVQTTPPHMENFSNPETNIVENEGNQKSSIVVENDSFSCEDSPKNICLKNATFKKKLVLNPCSRGKVFKAPGSFSYRRLLPYLKEVSNNNPYASELPSHRTVAIDIEEKKTNTNLPMAEDLHSQLTPMVESEANNETLLSAEKGIELQKPLDSPNISVLPVEEIISSIIVDLEHAYGDGEKSKTEMVSPPILSRSSGDNETMCRDNVQSNSSRGTNSPDSALLDQKSSQVDNLCSFEIPVNSKGILRRNPRGCRGLCNCLNCTSFRLNAERAFEFSKNQMLDSEEVALDLINELSGLRSLLKKSTMSSTGQATADINQVMEACKKALKAEESARYRLKEMRGDLTAHCRSKLLERPGVKFANRVNKMVIPRVDSPAGDKNSKQ